MIFQISGATGLSLNKNPHKYDDKPNFPRFSNACVIFTCFLKVFWWCKLIGRGKVLAIICARGGSKGIPRKNIRNFSGSPLIAWTIRCSLRSELVDHVIVSSEDEEILEIARNWGARTHLRPDFLATDEATTEDCVIDVLENNKLASDSSTIVVVQATSPLTSHNDLDDGLELFLTNGFDSVVSVVPTHTFQWEIYEDGSASPINYDPKHRKRRQEIKNIVAENGAFYIAKKSVWGSEKCRLGGLIGAYLMESWKGIEIDTMADWKRLEDIVEELGLTIS